MNLLPNSVVHPQMQSCVLGELRHGGTSFFGHVVAGRCVSKCSTNGQTSLAPVFANAFLVGKNGF